MRFAIDLDNQFAIESDEIHDVPINGVLTAKFPARELTVTKDLP
jgi:hypothetical protein